MLIVRSYGLGLAAGGVSVPLWLWIASLAEIGSKPVGIADRNPGADNTVPHAVTTVGMVATLGVAGGHRGARHVPPHPGSLGLIRVGWCRTVCGIPEPMDDG